MLPLCGLRLLPPSGRWERRPALPEVHQKPGSGPLSLPLFKDYVGGFFETHETHPSLKKGSHRGLYPRAFMPIGEVGELLDKMFKNGLRVHRARQRQITLSDVGRCRFELLDAASQRTSVTFL
jgi:hypothetical protein